MIARDHFTDTLADAADYEMHRALAEGDYLEPDRPTLADEWDQADDWRRRPFRRRTTTERVR